MENNFNVTCLTRNLKNAFYWMATATKEAMDGDIHGAAFSITTSLQYWLGAQHEQDLFFENESDVDWEKIVKTAMEEAKTELQNERGE